MGRRGIEGPLQGLREYNGDPGSSEQDARLKQDKDILSSELAFTSQSIHVLNCPQCTRKENITRSRQARRKYFRKMNEI